MPLKGIARVLAPLRAAGRPLLDLFAPPLCPLCGEAEPELGHGLCFTCHSQIHPIVSPCCPVCALPFSGVGPSHPCTLCLQKPPPFTSTAACGVFDSTLRLAIMNFKYHNRLALLPTLEHLFEGLLMEKLGGAGKFDCVVPVPCNLRGLRSRGFDLPSILSLRGARVLGATWRPEALLKLDTRVKMAGLGLKERKVAVRGLYAKREVVSGRVLLVDDVVTSTVTIRAASRALLRAGADEVMVAALARTPLGPRQKL